ncbi:recombinase zinc beta ribbon domain-containing protein [Streptomyces sp. NPDC058818]|uniref:recombinase zinc beta ribbon domain-containing protein n=1 Tax=Streptomyces sp. NPDC058818 TaxID=3346640 RepID=UPI0036B81BC7
MAELIAWARQLERTLVFGGQEDDGPLVIPPQAEDAVIRRCMDLARIAEDEAHTLSTRLTSSHAALRMIGRYGGGLVPFGYRKGGRRHGRDFARFRWTSGTLSKVLRSPSLMGHRIHKGQTVRGPEGSPVLIGPPLLTEDEFGVLQDRLRARSRGSRHRTSTNALLTAIAHCSGCDGRMYFAARKGYPHGDYACRATARGDVCPAPASTRSDWLESYTVAQYRETTRTDVPVTRDRLLASGARVTVAKGRCGGDTARLTGPDTSRLSFTLGSDNAVRHTR